MAAAAPLYTDVAEGPEGGAAYWLTTMDGVRVRAGIWPAAGTAKGTILLFPGRTEYIEKYGRTACDLTAAGYTVLVMDWRGQGLADRMHPDEKAGHVEKFRDYQHDVAAMMDLARELELPEPFHLIAHSMGGCIGLRALYEGLPVSSVAFSGPMWGISISAPVRPAAWVLGWGSGKLGLGGTYAPGTKPQAYVIAEPFENNQLTTSPEMFHHLQRQIGRYPELGIGGPSLTWLHEALLECRGLARMPSPDLPCRTFVGACERIVDIGRIRERMDKWPGGKLDVIEGAEHEVLMEIKSVRDWVTSEIIAHFDAHGRASGTAVPGGAIAQRA
ncbi:alpha/beta fold hydrolase [Pseudaestuariivita atlantica]|uniref:Hydrolase n=1 Tax=Pseudaestuariivita atlantica TaxID=1317121 RepID=A0A0L1JQI6_9RHOB|nr:alpha/beta hydrolase [Pseudaestuariivita atlantica]KNG93995.1 hydrolase [Pseudaestuariivita atlantica]